MSRCKTVSLLHIELDGVACGNKYKGAEESLDGNDFLRTSQI